MTEAPTVRFLNREISDLQFIQRVVEEAENLSHPLYERLRFLAISVSILDQFYTVRVARLTRLIREQHVKRSPDGLTPLEQIGIIQGTARKLMDDQQSIWLMLKHELGEKNIHLLNRQQLSDADLDWLRSHFVSHILPVVTPFTLDEEHPFPFIPSGGICAVLEFQDTHILVPLPDNLPRFITLPGKTPRFVPIELALFEFGQLLYGGEELKHGGLFQMLRDNELARQDQTDDLRSMIESGLKLRHKSNVIRLKVENLSEKNIRFVAGHLNLMSDEDIQLMELQGEKAADQRFISKALPGLSQVSELINPNLNPELVFPSYTSRYPQRLVDYDYDCFAAISAKDLLVHWPYESFEVVVRFLNQAAADANVLSIKQTLYRTNDDSPIVNAMVNAAANGKAVTAVIELEARENEQANVAMAKRLEAAGVQIVYGIIGLKIHCKITVITRREDDETVVYSHFGTGNYHPGNAKLYTDLSFFTCDRTLGKDANKVFNYITTERLVATDELVVAPKKLRHALLALIDAEITFANEGQPAQIWLKLNSLTDPELIEKLYLASGAGVQIDLIIRRHCTLIPGVEGMSANIRVKSIVGRFLEHARIYCFANGGAMGCDKALIYLASADWMERNMDGRVEIMVPLKDETVRAQVLDQIMTANIRDTRQSWVLDASGQYSRVKSDDQFCAQSHFMEVANLSGLGSHKHEAKVIQLKQVNRSD